MESSRPENDATLRLKPDGGNRQGYPTLDPAGLVDCGDSLEALVLVSQPRWPRRWRTRICISPWGTTRRFLSDGGDEASNLSRTSCYQSIGSGMLFLKLRLVTCVSALRDLSPAYTSSR